MKPNVEHTKKTASNDAAAFGTIWLVSIIIMPLIVFAFTSLVPDWQKYRSTFLFGVYLLTLPLVIVSVDNGEHLRARIQTVARQVLQQAAPVASVTLLYLVFYLSVFLLEVGLLLLVQRTMPAELREIRFVAEWLSILPSAMVLLTVLFSVVHIILTLYEIMTLSYLSRLSKQVHQAIHSDRSYKELIFSAYLIQPPSMRDRVLTNARETGGIGIVLLLLSVMLYALLAAVLSVQLQNSVLSQILAFLVIAGIIAVFATANMRRLIIYSASFKRMVDSFDYKQTINNE